MKLRSLILVVVAVSVAFAGDKQAGSVAIAQAAVPAAEVVVDGFAGCVERLVKVGTKNDKALKSCEKMANKASHTATRGFNEAADAAQASREPAPVIVAPAYGYGQAWVHTGSSIWGRR